MADPALNLISDPIKDRFWERGEMSRPVDCWPWKANISCKGYGRFWPWSGHKMHAHRFAYLIVKGEIKDGFVVDHICRRRDCCNPDHLRAITNIENVMIGVGVTAQNARKQYCLNGHPLSGANLAPGPTRQCRICRRERQRERRKTHPRSDRPSKAIRALIEKEAK